MESEGQHLCTCFQYHQLSVHTYSLSAFSRVCHDKGKDDLLNEKNVILILNEGIYLPLVNMFGELPTKLLYKCIVNKITIDKSNTVENVETKILDSSNKKNSLSLKAASSYKVSDLQTLASEHNIPITIEIDGKTQKKKKKKLYDELLLI